MVLLDQIILDYFSGFLLGHPQLAGEVAIGADGSRNGY
jgi:hypothetical protein